MKCYSYLIIVISIIIFPSFSRQEITLEKTWVLESYNSNNHTMTYRQETEFSEDKRGIQFLPNGKLKIKQAGGWCGTVSPGERINWVILDGTWTISSNSDIVLNYSYLANNTEKLKIIELSKNKLIVKNSNR